MPPGSISVRSADCIASVERWAKRDALGQKLQRAVHRGAPDVGPALLHELKEVVHREVTVGAISGHSMGAIGALLALGPIASLLLALAGPAGSRSWEVVRLHEATEGWPIGLQLAPL